ncbi:DUF4325 domain-containing protein [Flaviaesturariibacter flavus]|uniref:DUF4325 domain-containing protein n=1 Tax=Flaviaesturariibacter flavus TaxID=2502780 RepID=A0A4R1B3Z4_9BACT|nr:STAS-like domain-containing protein [Flaviaesturariibacter flavus]TCJ12180.1 DUF4325 domain-containing protein [Flaviaesturariibacter flavus]
MAILKISTDFSPFPGARYLSDGEESGQKFYEERLKQAFQDAIANGEKLTVDLDDTAGYASSFLDESFGRLAEDFTVATVLKNIEIISNDEPDWKEKILTDYIPNAPKRKKRVAA